MRGKREILEYLRGCGERCETIRVPVDGNSAIWGAALYIAFLAYPDLNGADKVARHKFMEAVVAAYMRWLVIERRNADIPDLAEKLGIHNRNVPLWIRRMKKRTIMARFGRAFRRIETRRLQAAKMAFGMLFAPSAFARDKTGEPLKAPPGPNVPPRLIRAVEWMQSSISTLNITYEYHNTKRRVWRESLPVVHLAMALPTELLLGKIEGARGVARLVFNPSWVAKAVWRAMVSLTFLNNKHLLNDCRSINLIPTLEI